MRKLEIFLTAIILLTFNQASAAKLEINYGSSKIYTQADMDSAIKIVKKNFGKWKGCRLKNIRYAGDNCNSSENLNWLNDLRPTENFAQCIEFFSDFYVAKKTNTIFNPNSEYKNWQWWLARKFGGDWQLVTFGY
ncbi:MAG: hypothetical protein IJT73_01065 [Selenomonadaceae bacterium]|nr:hypothetical protein [Selenomonadaceae bacterium]